MAVATAAARLPLIEAAAPLLKSFQRMHKFIAATNASPGRVRNFGGVDVDIDDEHRLAVPGHVADFQAGLWAAR